MVFADLVIVRSLQERFASPPGRLVMAGFVPAIHVAGLHRLAFVIGTSFATPQNSQIVRNIARTLLTPTIAAAR
jgi:hypothetical protein